MREIARYVIFRSHLIALALVSLLLAVLVPCSPVLAADFKNTPYYWRVKAIDNAHNESDRSTAGSFYVVSTSGFPSWGTYSLMSIGTVIVALLAFCLGRRTAYH